MMESDTKICPMCGETIKAVAVKCRFCNSDLALLAAESERTLFEGNPAMVYSVGQIVPFLLVLGIAVLVGMVRGTGEALIAWLAGSICVCIFFYVKSLGTFYRVTTQRIKLERGLLSKVQENLELFRVDHFEFRRPFGMRLLGQASLHLFSSDAEIPNFTIYGVPGWRRWPKPCANASCENARAGG